MFEISKNYPRSLIFVDNEGLEDGTVIATHWINKHSREGDDLDGAYDHEAARVAIEEARALIETTEQDRESWFPRKLNEDRKAEAVKNAMESIGEFLSSEEYSIPAEVYTLPSHLTAELKLDSSFPKIFSLIHLSETAIRNLLDQMSTKELLSSVEIINWPSDIESGSQRDMWYIYQTVLERLPEFNDFPVFFIDVSNAYETEGSPEIVLAYRRPSYEGSTEVSFIKNYSIPASRFNLNWERAFDSRGNKWWNDPLNAGLDREEIYPYGPPMAVTHPYVPHFLRSDLPMVILNRMTPTQERALRSLLCRGEELPDGFTNLPSSVDTMERLVEYLESKPFLQYYKKPPNNFIAIDSITLFDLDRMQQDDSVNPSVLLVTCLGIWHHDERGNHIARDEVGYEVGRGGLKDEDEDTYRGWSSNCFRGMGLGSCYESWTGDEDKNMGRYSWSCFDWGGELDDLAEVQC